MSFNAENWDSYLESFRTYFMELNSTDPNRFSLGLFVVKTPKHLLQMNLDDRDANGFWERFTVNSVHGKFQCEDSEGCGNVWKSVQIQVDLRVKILVLHS